MKNEHDWYCILPGDRPLELLEEEEGKIMQRKYAIDLTAEQAKSLLDGLMCTVTIENRYISESEKLVKQKLLRIIKQN